MNNSFRINIVTIRKGQIKQFREMIMMLENAEKYAKRNMILKAVGFLLMYTILVHARRHTGVLRNSESIQNELSLKKDQVPMKFC